MLLVVLITILIYSLILTIVTLYKDSSGYYTVDDIDIITAGPVCWVVALIFMVLKPFFKNRIGKKEEYKIKSSKYIQKTVKKIITIYRKNLQKWGYEPDYIDFSIHSGKFNVNEIEGWDVLMVKRARYEFINNRFERLMCHQKEETVKELKKYFSEAKDYDGYHESPVYVVNMKNNDIEENRRKFKAWADKWADKIWIGIIVFLAVASIASAIAALCTGIFLFARIAVTLFGGSILVFVVGDTIRNRLY